MLRYVQAVAVAILLGCQGESTEPTGSGGGGPTQQELADRDCKKQESKSFAVERSVCPAKMPDPVQDWMFESSVDGFCCFCHSGQCPGIHPCRDDIECGWCENGAGTCGKDGLCNCP